MIAAIPRFLVARPVRGTVHTYQVFIEPDRICFIRIGMGPGIDHVGLATGGLVGGLLGWWISSTRKKLQQRHVEENYQKTMEQMLAEHRANHAIAFSDISDVSLEPGGWMLAKGSVNWRFLIRGEQKRVLCTFRKIEDILIGMDVLPKLFPKLRLLVEFDERTGKFLKISK